MQNLINDYKASRQQHLKHTFLGNIISLPKENGKHDNTYQ